MDPQKLDILVWLEGILKGHWSTLGLTVILSGVYVRIHRLITLVEKMYKRQKRTMKVIAEEHPDRAIEILQDENGGS